MSFKVFFYLKLWWPFCSEEQNHFRKLGSGSPNEHSCEIILKSGHWPKRRCRLKVFFFFFFFSIFSSGSHFVHRSGTILAILVEGYPRNISVKLF